MARVTKLSDMIRETSQSAAATVTKPTNLVRRAVTVVIPAYNEEGGIADTISALKEAMRISGWDFEIVVVDDGSKDATASRADLMGVTVVRLDDNRGYGAALTCGIARAKFDWVAIIDADGTYPASEIPRMLERLPSSDMVVGARIGWKVQDPAVRRPAKWLLRKLASYLAGQEIPDLNSGLRVIRKTAVEKFSHILPSGFSFTTTITLAMISSGYSVAYVPIDYYKRVGKSKIKLSHAYRFAFMILRTMMLFQPMRVLGPVASAVILGGLAKLIYDSSLSRFSAMDVTILLQGMLVWCVAMLADQNARFHQPKR